MFFEEIVPVRSHGTFRVGRCVRPRPETANKHACAARIVFNRAATHRPRIVHAVGIAGAENDGKSSREQRIKGQDGAQVDEERVGGGNHPRRSRAHNLPIGTLHYSCLQLQPANQPGAPPPRPPPPLPLVSLHRPRPSPHP